MTTPGRRPQPGPRPGNAAGGRRSGETPPDPPRNVPGHTPREVPRVTGKVDSAGNAVVSRKRGGWNPSGSKTRTTPPATGVKRLLNVPPIDARSWSGAIIIMCAAAAVLWIIGFANASDNYGFNRFGLRPRQVDGLWGVLTEPFLHADYPHLASNTFPFIAVGWVLMLAGARTWLIVTALVTVLGGLLTWLVGPSDTVIVGASGLVFGWLGYLLARAFFSRKVKWILVAVAVLFFFGTLLFGLFPTLHSDVSWQAHVCGFVAGVVAGALLHPRGGDAAKLRRPAVSWRS